MKMALEENQIRKQEASFYSIFVNVYCAEEAEVIGGRK